MLQCVILGEPLFLSNQNFWSYTCRTTGSIIQASMKKIKILLLQDPNKATLVWVGDFFYRDAVKEKYVNVTSALAGIYCPPPEFDRFSHGLDMN